MNYNKKMVGVYKIDKKIYFYLVLPHKLENIIWKFSTSTRILRVGFIHYICQKL